MKRPRGRPRKDSSEKVSQLTQRKPKVPKVVPPPSLTVLARQNVEDALEEEMRQQTDDVLNESINALSAVQESIVPLKEPKAPDELPFEEKETESPMSQDKDERPRSFLIQGFNMAPVFLVTKETHN